MISIGENTPEQKCAKKYKKIEFYLSKFSTGDHPKKYRNSTELLKINTTKFQVEREPVLSFLRLVFL